MKSSGNPGLAMLMLAAGIVASLTQLSHAQNREVIDEARLVSPNERVTLDVMRGEVTIRPGDDNTLRIRGVLDELAEGYELESGNGFTQFTVVMPRNMRNRGGDRDDGSDLEIIVPAGSDVQFSGVNVDVDIADIQGGARITTVNGGITASGLREFIQLHTVNGSINSQNSEGRIEIETVNGEVTDRGSQGRISLRAVNGEIDIDSRAEEVQLTVVNGEINASLSSAQSLEFSGVNGSIDIRLREVLRPRVRGSSVSGEISLGLDAGVDARFNLQSNVGRRIENELSDDEPQRPQFGPGRSLRFMTGEGSGTVDITTVSGEIRLRRN